MTDKKLNENFAEQGTAKNQDLIYTHKFIMTLQGDMGDVAVGRQCLAMRNPHDSTWDVTLVETPENDLAKTIIEATPQEIQKGISFYEAIEVMERHAASITNKNRMVQTLSLGEEPVEDINGNTSVLVEVPELAEYHYMNHPNMRRFPGEVIAEEEGMKVMAGLMGSGRVTFQIKPKAEKPDEPDIS